MPPVPPLFTPQEEQNFDRIIDAMPPLREKVKSFFKPDSFTNPNAVDDLDVWIVFTSEAPAIRNQLVQELTYLQRALGMLRQAQAAKHPWQHIGYYVQGISGALSIGELILRHIDRVNQVMLQWWNALSQRQQEHCKVQRTQKMNRSRF